MVMMRMEQVEVLVTKLTKIDQGVEALDCRMDTLDDLSVTILKEKRNAPSKDNARKAVTGNY